MDGSKGKVFTYIILILVIVIVGSILVLTSVGKASKNPVTTTVQASTTIKSTTTINKTSVKTLTPPPAPSCAPSVFPINSTIVNVIGLSESPFYRITQYTIAAGNTGRISYNISISGASQGTVYNITNVAQLYNATNSIVGTSWEWNSIVPSSFGINISYLPTNEILTYNNIVPINASISIASNAPNGTYWMFLSPGPCEGDSPIILLTVGIVPYNGPIEPTGQA